MIFKFKQNPQAQMRLFCFSYAGGGASVFRTWWKDLPSQIEVCPVQLPGRENRINETPFDEFASLIQAVMRYLRPELTMPFAFFGHSMGALVSFEIARQLRRQKVPAPKHLFVSAHRAPQLPDPDPPVHHLPEPEFIAELHRLKGTPPNILKHNDIMEMMLPALRADFKICETYTYTQEPPLACPISVFGGIDDDELTRDELAAWREQTSGSFALHMCEGNHFFLHDARETLLQTVSDELNRHLRRIF